MRCLGGKTTFSTSNNINNNNAKLQFYDFANICLCGIIANALNAN